MHILIIYCHPSKNSFTFQVKEEYIKGLLNAGHTYEISDLYKMRFDGLFTEQEYMREAFYDLNKEIPEDVKAEQEKLNRADAVTFIYPVFWTEAPALLVGWFQRVWTYGFAYGEHPGMHTLKKATFLVTMGGSLQEEIRREQLKAMEVVMVGDRIHNRAKECEMVVFDEMTRGYGNDKVREEKAKQFLVQAYELGRKA